MPEDCSRTLDNDFASDDVATCDARDNARSPVSEESCTQSNLTRPIRALIRSSTENRSSYSPKLQQASGRRQEPQHQSNNYTPKLLAAIRQPQRKNGERRIHQREGQGDALLQMNMGSNRGEKAGGWPHQTTTVPPSTSGSTPAAQAHALLRPLRCTKESVPSGALVPKTSHRSRGLHQAGPPSVEPTSQVRSRFEGNTTPGTIASNQLRCRKTPDLCTWAI